MPISRDIFYKEKLAKFVLIVSLFLSSVNFSGCANSSLQNQQYIQKTELLFSVSLKTAKKVGSFKTAFKKIFYVLELKNTNISSILEFNRLIKLKFNCLFIEDLDLNFGKFFQNKIIPQNSVEESFKLI